MLDFSFVQRSERLLTNQEALEMAFGYILEVKHKKISLLYICIFTFIYLSIHTYVNLVELCYHFYTPLLGVVLERTQIDTQLATLPSM